jgi:mannose-6-phosphate isomerase-like protein (cupin superfamily)
LPGRVPRRILAADSREQQAMANRIVSREEMLSRTAIFSELQGSSRPLVDAVLPQYHREIFQIIGSGVTEDPEMKVPITAVEGFHLSIIKAGPGKGTGLHNHKTVEVFMPLTGQWAVIWGDNAANELVIGQYDVVSVPVGVMRGFRNDGEGEALLLAIVGGTDPGKVDWAQDVREQVRARGFDLDAGGKIIELSK